MDTLNFINNSNDSNNSKVVIFQGSEQLAGGMFNASNIVTVTPGTSASVPAEAGKQFYVALINPEISVAGGVLKISEYSSPAVSMVAGQTASITGDADAGYEIVVD